MDKMVTGDNPQFIIQKSLGVIDSSSFVLVGEFSEAIGLVVLYCLLL